MGQIEAYGVIVKVGYLWRDLCTRGSSSLGESRILAIIV